MSDDPLKGNWAIDKAVANMADRARLGAKVAIWQMIEMPMSNPGFRGIDLLEAPIDKERLLPDGSKISCPVETSPCAETMVEDEAIRHIASVPQDDRALLLAEYVGQNVLPPGSHYFLLSIMAQPPTPPHDDVLSPPE